MSETKSVLALRDLASLLGRSPETIRKDLRRVGADAILTS